MSGKKVRRRRDDGVWGGPGSPGGNAERLEIEGVSEDSIVELREAFNLFNIHSADKIPSSEIVSAMRSIGFSEKNPMFVDYLLAIDQRRQGTPMTFDEYAEAITSMIKEAWQTWREDDLMTMFKMLGSSGTDDFIVAEDLKQLAKDCGETLQEWELLEMMDVTRRYVAGEEDGAKAANSGQVSVFEFLNFIATAKEEDDDLS